MSDNKRYNNICSVKKNNISLDCPVEILKGALLYDNFNDITVLQLKLCNVSKDTILSAYVSIDCFDDAGDPIDNDNTVEFCYQDLKTLPRGVFGDNVAIPLKGRNVRKVNVYFPKIVFVNGNVMRSDDYEGETIIPELTSINELGDSLINEFKMIKSEDNLHNVEFIPRDFPNLGWNCCCGRINKLDNKECCRCGREKEWQFKVINRLYLQNLYNNHEIEQNKIREEERKIAKIKEENTIIKRKRIKTTVILIFIIMCFVSLVMLIYINSSYKKAENLMKSGNYTESLKTFNKISFYKDSEQYIKKEQTYNKALNLLKIVENSESNTDEGIDKIKGLIESIKDYRDSNKIYTYVCGLRYMEEDNLEKALTAFNEIKEFRNTNNLLDEIKSKEDKELVEQNKIKSAYTSVIKEWNMYMQNPKMIRDYPESRKLLGNWQDYKTKYIEDAQILYIKIQVDKYIDNYWRSGDLSVERDKFAEEHKMEVNQCIGIIRSRGSVKGTGIVDMSNILSNLKDSLKNIYGIYW